MSLYTIFLDYDEGTYITQEEANSPDNAINQWIRSLDLVTLKAESDQIEEIIKKFKEDEEELVLLYGMKNVWCLTLMLNNKLALVHIVKTSNR